MSHVPKLGVLVGMELMVNGLKQMVPDGITVSRLLDTLKVTPERVVIEVNLTILKRAEHPTTTLKDGDQVEIIHFVGGGSSARTGRLYFRHSFSLSENRNVPRE